MRILMVGCEYTGTTTLAVEISKWIERVVGGVIHGGLAFHDHFKGVEAGHIGTEGPKELSEEDLKDYFSWSDRHRQSYKHYLMTYHVQETFIKVDPHHLMIGMHIDDEIFGMRYLGYDEGGKPGFFRLMSIHTESKIMEHGPDTILMLVKASPEVVRKRMRDNPHPHGMLKDGDVEDVLAQFEDLYEKSNVGVLGRRFILDTSNATIEETMAEFVEKITPHLSRTDQLRIMTRSNILATIDS